MHKAERIVKISYETYLDKVFGGFMGKSMGGAMGGRRGLAMKKILALSMAMAIAAGRAGAAGYFVDAEAGDDANSGTEAAKPWKSLEKAGALVLQPGDRLLFRAGREWQGTLRIRGAGARQSRIFIGKYGDGALPRIDGGGARTAVTVVNASFLTIQDLEITNRGEQDGKTLRSGLEVSWAGHWQPPSAKPAEKEALDRPGRVVLRRLYVHDVQGVIRRRPHPNFYENAGIMIYNRSKVDLSDVYVENCRLEDLRGVGCYIRCTGWKGVGGATGPGAMIDDVRFCDNTIRRTAADGLIVTHGRGVFVAGNRCFDIGALGDRSTEAIAGIWVGWHCHDSVFQYNEVARTRCPRKDGNAFDVDNECTGTHIFQYNYTHGNEGGPLMVMPSARGRVIYRYNVSVNDFKSPHPQGKPGFWVEGTGQALIHNNTLMMDNGSPLTVSDNPRIAFVNNILVNRMTKTVHPSKPEFRRNCFVGEHQVRDPDRIAGDPMFTEPGEEADGMGEIERYRLRPGSSCRDAGIVRPEFSGDGHFVNRPDIGAMETLSAEGGEFRQWRVTELAFEAEPGKVAPIEVEFSATFTGPNGVRLIVPGYWDGGRAWRVRVTPTAPGKWSYTTACRDIQGLDGHTGSFTAGPAAGNNPFHKHGGILRVSGNRHYVTYSDGTPFFWLGDTCWFCPSERAPIDCSSDPKYPSMFKALLERRGRQGFTVLQIAFLGQSRELLRTLDPRTWQSKQMTFWRRADQYVACANEAGIVPAIGVGWGPSIAQRPAEDLRLLWRHMVARYGAMSVTWLVCGEYNQFNKTESIRYALSLGKFIKDLDPYKRAMSVHAWYSKREKRQAWGEPWYDFVMLQGGHKVWPKTVRWAAYRAIQSGSFGYTYGSHGLWNVGPDPEPGDWGPPTEWGVALDRPGGEQMGHLRRCYESVEWWKLEPRPEAVSLKGGESIHVKADGSRVFLVYFDRGLDPNLKAVLKDGDPALTYRAVWFNPRNGKEQPLTGEVRMPGGEWALPERPDKEDWMLLIRARE
jgi:hypothetical protein